MEKEKQQNLRPFGMRDKLGYAAGDFANNMTFALQSSYIMIFYTDVWNMSPNVVGTMLMIARILDAFADIVWGRIVDVSPAREDGKFRPWIRRLALPVALTSFLMYQSGLQNMAMPLKIVYMYVTYLLWMCVCYSGINIPYGSMSSAVTDDPNGRSDLSTFRNVGSVVGQMLVNATLPLIIYEVNDAGQQVVKTDATFTVVAGIFSILAIVFYFFCYRNTLERVDTGAAVKGEKSSFGQTIKRVLKNRGLIGIIVAALALVFAQTTIQQVNVYLYPVYFNNTRALSIVNTVTNLVMIFISAPLATALVRRIGRRSVAFLSTLLAAGSYFVLYFIRTENVIVFMVLSCLAFVGLGGFNSVIWAMISDVIDDIEVQTYTRDDGTVYSIYSFARKIGQAISSQVAGSMLTAVGYVAGAATQSARTVSGIYNLGTVIPGIGFIISALALILIYPLNRQRVAENTEELSTRREAAEEDNN